LTLDARLLEILACPADKGPLLYFDDGQALYNPRRRLRYRVEDEIPVMLTEEASTADDVEHERLMARAEAAGLRPTFEAGDPGGPES